jgi:hypothetical protein
VAASVGRLRASGQAAGTTMHMIASKDLSSGRIVSDAATLESGVVVPQQVRFPVTRGPSSSILRCGPKRKENGRSLRLVHGTPRSITPSSQEVKTAQGLSSDEQNVA